MDRSGSGTYRGLVSWIKGDKLTLETDVANIGEKAGAEVIQLYVQDVESSLERPVKELKGFKKVMLQAGEKKRISIELTKEDLSFL